MALRSSPARAPWHDPIRLNAAATRASRAERGRDGPAPSSTRFDPALVSTQTIEHSLDGLRSAGVMPMKIVSPAGALGSSVPPVGEVA